MSLLLIFAQFSAFCCLGLKSDPMTVLFHWSGKRKALKLNFANPPIKPTTRFTLNTAGPPFQNPHMWVNLWASVHFPKKEIQLYNIHFSPFVLSTMLFLERGWEHTASSHQENWRFRRSSTGTSLPRTWKIWARLAEGLTALSTRWCTSRVTRLWPSRWSFTSVWLFAILFALNYDFSLRISE